MRDIAIVFRRAAVAAAAIVGLASTPARADSPATDAWQFEVTPYLFGIGLKGTTGVRSVTADIDADLNDLLEKLDSAFMGAFEARKGPWAIAFDGIYARLEDEKSRSWQGPGGIGSANGELDVTMTQQVYQLALGYRVLDSQTKLDVLGAARYSQLDADVDLTRTSAILPDGSRSASGSESWWDPVVGIRVIVPIAEHWSLTGYVDYGGFGIGSDSTYQAIAGVNWKFSESLTAKFGYRYLYQDYEDDEKRFVWDMAMQGFYLGLGIGF